MGRKSSSAARLKSLRIGKARAVRPQTDRYGDRPPADDIRIRDADCPEHGVGRAVYLPSGRWSLLCCGKTVESEVKDD